MREHAGIIQKEVSSLIDDIHRLDERIENLSKHFKQASEDIDGIKTSSSKITKRMKKIESIEIEEIEKASVLAVNE